MLSSWLGSLLGGWLGGSSAQPEELPRRGVITTRPALGTVLGPAFCGNIVCMPRTGTLSEAPTRGALSESTRSGSIQ